MAHGRHADPESTLDTDLPSKPRLVQGCAEFGLGPTAATLRHVETVTTKLAPLLR
jgi:hypothetical protein